MRSCFVPFGCTTRGGLSTLDAEPSITCNKQGIHGRMVTIASLTLVVYGIGIPAAFAYFLRANRAAIRADQTLRQRGEGDLATTNPNLKIRRCVVDTVAVERDALCSRCTISLLCRAHSAWCIVADGSRSCTRTTNRSSSTGS
jgi:hypothetical protein